MEREWLHGRTVVRNGKCALLAFILRSRNRQRFVCERKHGTFGLTLHSCVVWRGMLFTTHGIVG